MSDKSGFDEFVITRSQTLLRTAYLLVQDEGRAEDLLQTALTKAWFAWDRVFDAEAHVRRIMVTTSASWWRRRWTTETPTEQLPEYAEIPGDPASGQDLWAAIGRLPRRQRAVVVLRYIEDRSETETADLLDCAVGTVKSQCSKALVKLRLDAALEPVAEERSRS